MDLPFLRGKHGVCNKIYVLVSILVLMDLPFLQLGTTVKIVSFKYRFNPCSYGSSVLTVLNKLTISTFKVVSILVLMDLPFLLII